jgi:3-oxoacyl-[acyl-carrier protein] reductase
MTQRIALVTGASRGIGRAIAVQLARDGLLVVVNYRTGKDAAMETSKHITEAGGECVLRCFDVSDPDQVKESIRSITSEFGIIDVLVNNAAVGILKPIKRVKREDWNCLLAVNLGGLHYCTQATVMTWVGRKYGSRIINITSIGGECGFTDSSSYAATKAGIIGFSKSLAIELGPKGVTVNAIAPGYVVTDISKGLAGDEIVAKTPVRRAGRPEDIAYVVSFLASDRASFITGQVIRVNGGLYT